MKIEVRRGPRGGVLVNGQGHLVLGDGGPISVPPADTIEISRDGTVSVAPAGSNGTELVTVGRIKLVRPGAFELEKGEDGLLRMKDGSLAPVDANVQLQAGSLERSNVNAVESLVNMIELSRLFETQVRMMKVADEFYNFITNRCGNNAGKGSRKRYKIRIQSATFVRNQIF